METTVRMPRSRSQRRSLAMNSSTPGPCRPIELSIPDGVSAMRGVGRPERALSMIDLVTTAPIAVRSRNGASSRPAAAHPEAVSTGSGIWNVPRRVDMSTRAGRRATEAVAAISAPLPRVRPSVSAGTVPTSAQRTSLPLNTGPVGAGADHPGDAVGSAHRQHAGHAHADPAGHRLLDGALAVRPGLGGDRCHGGQHRHRSAGVDDVGPGRPG